METVATILDTETDSQVIHREGRDIAAISCASAITIAVHARLAQALTMGAAHGTDDVVLSYTLVANEPLAIDVNTFAGLLEFKFVASVAVGADTDIYIGFRDLR